ncbi:NUDIX hydrolase [Alicyclobacillus tolerans]|uniref:NUDIX hydrolase n=1 Tax=Alicyclobacillus tolerans TaxID=90970 RepID=UPI001F1D2CC7|nr:NUDIX hydrolase [Alicyclobacillus tolerans]MCF8567624.1 NUDIX hydrolase [Alicyclobacillus tolerans]
MSYLERLPSHLKHIGSSRKGEIEILQTCERGVGIVYEDSFIIVLKDKVKFPSDKIGTYIRIVSKNELDGGVNGTAVLPVLHGKISVVEVFRHSLRKWCMEIPRGFRETGYTVEETVRKEVLEELGYTVNRIYHLSDVHPDDGLLTATVGLYLAELDKEKKRESEDTEAFGKIHFLSPKLFEKLILTGGIQDSFSISAFYLAKAKGLLI